MGASQPTQPAPPAAAARRPATAHALNQPKQRARKNAAAMHRCALIIVMRARRAAAALARCGHADYLLLRALLALVYTAASSRHMA